MQTEKKIPRFAAYLAAFAVCLTAMLALFGVRAYAASVEWDGRSGLEADKHYIITEEVKVKKDIVIPEGTKLSVKDGGSLKVYSSGSITVRGELSVAVGGYLKNSGNINIKKSGTFSVYGDVQSSLNGSLDIAGNLTIYNAGSFEISSQVKVYKSAYIFNKGTLAFYKSSDVKMSGVLETRAKSDLQFRGIMQISLSGDITVGGHLTIGAASNVKCSGKITLTDTADYTRFRIITVTKSGKFIDNRPAVENENMTVDVIFDEKKVKRKGIDVSYAQGEIDWDKVAESGVEFAIIRAGRGNASKEKPMKEDDYFRRNIEEAQRCGIDVGVYFYSYASTVAEAKAEAEFYVDIIKGYKLQYPVILDMEEQYQGKLGKKKLTNMIEAFFDVLMENNYYPMLYSFKAWIEAYLDMKELDKYALWLAQVNDVVTYDGGYYIWQYSFTGKVSGINGTVDLDISYRDFEKIFKELHLNNY